LVSTDKPLGVFCVQAGDVSGHVQDIGFMQTHVQGFDGVPVLVPNQAFTSQVSCCIEVFACNLNVYCAFDSPVRLAAAQKFLYAI